VPAVFLMEIDDEIKLAVAVEIARPYDVEMRLIDKAVC